MRRNASESSARMAAARPARVARPSGLGAAVLVAGRPQGLVWQSQGRRRDGEVGETTGASKFNVTDMFYGDGTPISAEDLEHIDEVTMRNLQYVPMEQGDVVLVDNYQVMHGRDVFEGERLHAVTWFQ